MLDTYYPANLQLTETGLYINLLFLRKPVVKNNTLTVEITGETFDESDWLNRPDLFVPTSCKHNIPYLPLSPEAKKNILMTVNVEAVQTLIHTIMSTSFIKIEYRILTSLGIGGVGFDFGEEVGVTIDRADICIKDARVILFKTDLTTPIISLGATLCIQIHNLDLMKGSFNIYIGQFRLNTTEKVDSWLDSLAATFTLIDFSENIKQIIAGYDFKVQKLMLDLKPGMILKPINLYGYANAIVVTTGISYDSSLSEKTYFLESARADPNNQVIYSMSNDPEWLKKICGSGRRFLAEKSRRRLVIV